MEEYKESIFHNGIVVPLDIEDINTDVIIPKQFLKSIKKTGFKDNVFYEWRYLRNISNKDNLKRTINPNFVLNKERYKNASILLTRKNFGCGSSREHAVWSLKEYGFKVLIAPSFADIFLNNCYKNSVLPIILENKEINYLFNETYKCIGYNLSIDINSQIILTNNGEKFLFKIDEFNKQFFLYGVDEIYLTLKKCIDHIRNFEYRHIKGNPWMELKR